ncbi:hypothetical protein W822_06520 [Advenella kashmirensis W13003]|uniref:Uncharacterized protein n=1 Tax=Advenella kashmirensis W13003 TaxID=1424334 RepID=V8QVT5_9BURK|nr:hypothetical protein W822_06520 [Advenella kashmirensis W13003]
MEEYIEGASVEKKGKNQNGGAESQLKFSVSPGAECGIRFGLARSNVN